MLYLSERTYEGIILSTPSNLSVGTDNSSHTFKLYDANKYNKGLRFYAYVASEGHWNLQMWATPYRFRFGFRGWVQVEMKRIEGYITRNLGTRVGISCAELL